jgi:hypothetical protein
MSAKRNNMELSKVGEAVSPASRGRNLRAGGVAVVICPAEEVVAPEDGLDCGSLATLRMPDSPGSMSAKRNNMELSKVGEAVSPASRGRNLRAGAEYVHRHVLSGLLVESEARCLYTRKPCARRVSTPEAGGSSMSAKRNNMELSKVGEAVSPASRGRNLRAGAESSGSRRRSPCP